MPRITRFDQFNPSKDERSAFECGNELLTTWLRSYAGQSMATRDAVTYLLHEQREILGYFTLSAGSVSRHQAGAGRIAKRAPEPIPMILLGRMAVHSSYQGRGFGAELVRQALRRAASSAFQIGARGLLVHAIESEAQSFYRHLGFGESSMSPRQMMISFEEMAANEISSEEGNAGGTKWHP